jgi:hypothetical protein
VAREILAVRVQIMAAVLEVPAHFIMAEVAVAHLAAAAVLVIPMHPETQVKAVTAA